MTTTDLTEDLKRNPRSGRNYPRLHDGQSNYRLIHRYVEVENTYIVEKVLFVDEQGVSRTIHFDIIAGKGETQSILSGTSRSSLYKWMTTAGVEKKEQTIPTKLAEFQKELVELLMKGTQPERFKDAGPVLQKAYKNLGLNKRWKALYELAGFVGHTDPRGAKRVVNIFIELSGALTDKANKRYVST